MFDLSAQGVQKFFRDLGLVICDDSALITKKANDRRAHYNQLAQRANPEKRALAHAWTRLNNRAMNRLPELLELVYEDFRYNAEVSVVSAKRDTVDQALLDILEELAKRSCLWRDTKRQLEKPSDDRMYREWVERLHKPPPEGMDLPPVGNDIVRKALVDKFSVVSGEEAVCLAWELSGGKCDEIEIVRTAVSSGKSGRVSKKSAWSIRGQQTKYEDESAKPGSWYEYQARAVYQNEEGKFCPPQRGCRLGPVSNINAEINAKGVMLSWQPPGTDIPVCIFRRSGKSKDPEWTTDCNGLLSPKDDTERTYYGSARTFCDKNIKQGVYYNYLIVADFGEGTYVRPKAVVPVYVPPPVAPVLHAIAEAGGQGVRVSWGGVKGRVAYKVVRKEGSVAPSRADEEGCVCFDAKDSLALQDNGVIVGKRYTYAVFACQGDRTSPVGADTNPVDILAEVSDIGASVGDSVVELHWNPPKNVKRIIVRRKLNHDPTAPDDGTQIQVSGLGHLQDTDVHNGNHYFYRVYCVFRPDGANDVITEGVAVPNVVPEQLPDVVADLDVHQEGAEAVCVWTPPSAGEVQVWRSREKPELRFGERFSLTETKIPGSSIPAEVGGQGIDPHPDVNEPYYTVYTMAGSHAIAGNTARCVVAVDVQQLEATQTQSLAILKWQWPENCLAVIVARRNDQWPTAHDDVDATTERYTKDLYDRAGGKFVDVNVQKSGTLYYVVYAEVQTAEGTTYAQGLSDGCRYGLPWNTWMRLTYSLSQHPNRKALVLNWEAKNTLDDFSGFVLLAARSKVPTSREDDLQLFPSVGSAFQPDGSTGSKEIPLDKVSQWQSFYCKIFLADGEQRRRVVVVHPDTGVTFTPSGRPQKPSLRPVPHTYKAGTPRKVVCPVCWKPFPVEKMKFATYAEVESGNASPRQHPNPWHIRARRLWRKQALKYPNNSAGRRLACKFCPDEHELPVLAGHQPSLIIGLLGSSASGKTTYVTALHRAIRERLSSDFSVALHAATEYTKDTMGERDKLLFGQQIPLPATLTAQVEQPLVLDLSVNGKLWNQKQQRGISLIFCDTAGDNFDDPAQVEKWMPYLRMSAGIVFLIDPLQIDRMAMHLSGEPDAGERMAPEDVITNVRAELPDGEVPVAIALSKCDMLREAGLIEPNRLWNMAERHEQVYDRSLHDDMAGMMREIVRNAAPNVHNSVEESFRRHAFFGVSSTGSSQQEDGKYPYVAPWRVEDPLLWLLSELEVIPKGE